MFPWLPDMHPVAEAMTGISMGQEGNGYILTGFYLSDDQLAAVIDILSADSTTPKSCGRFEGIPVFRASTKRRKRDSEACDSGIAFTYQMFRMASVPDNSNPA
jgi:hypothetical protein